jgi:hypothetical protein
MSCRICGPEIFDRLLRADVRHLLVRERLLVLVRAHLALPEGDHAEQQHGAGDPGQGTVQPTGGGESANVHFVTG